MPEEPEIVHEDTVKDYPVKVFKDEDGDFLAYAESEYMTFKTPKFDKKGDAIQVAISLAYELIDNESSILYRSTHGGLTEDIPHGIGSVGNSKSGSEKR